MAEIIQQSYANVRESEDVSQGRYDLVSTDGEIILKSLWARLVRPGWEIKMIMWPKQDPNRVEPIKFKDAVGRKFTFPFHIVKTWEDINEIINQAFLHVDVIGPHVKEGHYDLIGPDGGIILPGAWESTIGPGMNISMHMWPMDKIRQPPPPMPPPISGPRQITRPRPPQPPMQLRSQMGTLPPPMPGPPPRANIVGQPHPHGRPNFPIRMAVVPVDKPKDEDEEKDKSVRKGGTGKKGKKRRENTLGAFGLFPSPRKLKESSGAST